MQWKKEGYDVIADVSGELDLQTSEDFRVSMDKMLDTCAGAQRFILNMEHVSFIDSSGLGVLFGRQKKLISHGATLIIVGPQPQVRRALDLLGVPTVIPVYNSEKQAREARAEGRR